MKIDKKAFWEHLEKYSIFIDLLNTLSTYPFTFYTYRIDNILAIYSGYRASPP